LLIEEDLKMNANQRQTTAKIYQFPLKSSAIAGRSMLESRSANDRRLADLPMVEFGSGWYHEAAVQAERPRRS
jgi:Protein of unknown function (DUF2735)